MNEAQQKTDLEQASKSERDVHDVEEAERTIGDERVNNQGSARPVESVTQRQDDLDDVEPGVRCARKADGSPLFAEEGEDWKGNECEENAHETQLRNGAQPPQLDAVPSIFTSAEGRHKTSQPCDAHAKPGDAQEKERIFQAEVLETVARLEVSRCADGTVRVALALAMSRILTLANALRTSAPGERPPTIRSHFELGPIRRKPGVWIYRQAEFKTCTVGDTTQKQVLNRAGRILGAHPLAEPVGSRGHRFALTRIAAFAIAVIRVLPAAD